MAIAASRRFKQLIEPELDGLYRTAYRLTRNRSDAEDLVQETCIRACRQLAALRDDGSVRGWLLTVLHNLFVDGARRAQTGPIAALSAAHDPDGAASPDPGPEEHAARAEREAELGRAWARLDRGHQMLLALRAEGYSLAEISRIAEVPLDALHARLYRARLNLARYLHEAGSAGLDNGLEMAK
jgi:RNA polymerase sigma-70 factor (ECF subfamily)